MSKSTGSYYTPQKLVEYIVNRVTRNLTEKSNLKVLEPSCGDGVFLQAFQNSNIKGSVFLDAVEKSSQAIKIAQRNTSKLNKKVKLMFTQGDFLKVKLETNYDLVIGNPPYMAENY